MNDHRNDYLYNQLCLPNMEHVHIIIIVSLTLSLQFIIYINGAIIMFYW